MQLDYTRAAELYRASGMGGSVGIGERPAVLVVDFTYGFTDPHSQLGCDMTEAVLATRALLDAARPAGVSIYFTVNGFRDDLRDAGVWKEKFPGIHHLRLGDRSTELDERLGAQDHDPVVVKAYPSAFFGTPLQSMLVAERVDSIVVCGTTTSGCVRATAVDALQHGYRVVIPEECVADRDPAPHHANLFDLRTKYADVVCLRTAIGLLTGAVTTATAAS